MRCRTFYSTRNRNSFNQQRLGWPWPRRGKWGPSYHRLRFGGHIELHFLLINQFLPWALSRITLYNSVFIWMVQIFWEMKYFYKMTQHRFCRLLLDDLTDQSRLFRDRPHLGTKELVLRFWPAVSTILVTPDPGLPGNIPQVQRNLSHYSCNIHSIH